MEIQRPAFQLAFIPQRRAEKHHNRKEGDGDGSRGNIFDQPDAVGQAALLQQKESGQRSQGAEQIGKNGKEPKRTTTVLDGPAAFLFPETEEKGNSGQKNDQKIENSVHEGFLREVNCFESGGVIYRQADYTGKKRARQSKTRKIAGKSLATLR